MAKAEVEAGSCQKLINIFADNQAAIRSLIRPEDRSGAYILKKITTKVDSLQKSGQKVMVRWRPSHEGIEGNEAADMAAKEATGWRDGSEKGPRADLPTELYTLQDTRKMWTRKDADRNWQSSWQQGTRGRSTFRHTPAPSKKVLQLHEGPTKRRSAIMVQMRTEKIGLRTFSSAGKWSTFWIQRATIKRAARRYDTSSWYVGSLMISGDRNSAIYQKGRAFGQS
jgi:hypothetical protein